MVLSAWQDINPFNVWDCHVHLIGVGDNQSGIYVNPEMQSLLHPIQYSQFKMYMNASCAESGAHENIDSGVVGRLGELLSGVPKGMKLMLLAFDYYHNERGQVMHEYSAFHTPNDYAQKIAASYPDRFEWIASIHPYRINSVELLGQAIKKGARALKWLPGAMGINPASPLCDPFYEALAKAKLPLLVHTGTEHAVETPGGQELGNPLLLRRALQHNVTVILAHCATTGQSIDLDKGNAGPMVDNFSLFTRLMDQTKYEKLLYGDISAIVQVNREDGIVRSLVENQHWHHRLLFGSDYPLPGVIPLISTQRFVEQGGLAADVAAVLIEIRQHNVILYDFLLKRHLKFADKQFSAALFETRDFFQGRQKT